MSFQLFDPQPSRHEYVTRMYFEPMLAYAEDNRIPLTRTDHLTPSRGVGMVCDADYLTPQVIQHFKENDCQLFGFSCIDSAYLPEVMRFNPMLPMVNRIFMISGVPTTNWSNATTFDNAFNIKSERRQYLPEETWDRFDFMQRRGAIQSLPYLIWNRMRIPERKSFDQRRPTILFRGGAHFLRVIAYFVALQKGCADEASGFLLRDYFKEEMNPQFRYCDECRSIFRKNNGFPYGEGTGDECRSIAEWGESLDLSSTGIWNNKCPRSFYWLAEQFAQRHGPMDMEQLECAMNFLSEPEQQHRETVANVRFFADAKWEFSIYAAQRFWEAASAGTVNLLPRRANDQRYFPEMQDGEHYLTFSDDFSDLTADIGESDFNRISQNAYALWNKWIRPDAYAISTNLLKHIFDTIQTPRDT